MMLVHEPLALVSVADPAIFDARDAVFIEHTRHGRRALRTQNSIVPDR